MINLNTFKMKLTRQQEKRKRVKKRKRNGERERGKERDGIDERLVYMNT